MRQILIGDIIAAARSILDVPSVDRAAAIAKMFYNAHVADKVTKRTGLPHKNWGNGSLLSIARPMKPEPFLSDHEFLEALRITIDELIAWKRANQTSHRRHSD